MDGARERKRAAFFWLRLGLLVGLSLAFWLTGAGAWLAGRVAGGGGTLGYAVFVALCVATYEALMFPVTRAANAALGDVAEGFGAWLGGYLLAMAMELGAVTASAVAGRWLVEALGRWWWVGGAAAYAVLSPEMWPVALWARREKMSGVETPGWLARANAALEKAGRRQAGGVAVYDSEGRELREMYYSYGRGRTPTLVVVKEAWEEDGEDALVFGAVCEGVRRRYRRWGRVVSAGLAAAVLWGAGRAVGGTGLEDGIGSAAAFPAMAVWLFALATAGGCLRNWLSKLADGMADDRACEALGGADEMRAWVDAARRTGGAEEDVPWWVEALRKTRAPQTRLAAACMMLRKRREKGKGRQE